MLDADNAADNQASDSSSESTQPAAPAAAESVPGDTAAQGVSGDTTAVAPAKKAATKRATAKKTATKKTAAKRTTKRATSSDVAPSEVPPGDGASAEGVSAGPTPVEDAEQDTAASSGHVEPPAPAKKAAAKRTTTKKAAAKKAAAKTTTVKRTTKKAAEQPVEVETAGTPVAETEPSAAVEPAGGEPAAMPTATAGVEASGADASATEPQSAAGPAVPIPLFQPPEPTKAQPRRKKAAAPKPEPEADEAEVEKPAKKKPKKQGKGRADEQERPEETESTPADREQEKARDEEAEGEGGHRRRRRRGGRRRRTANGSAESETAEKPDTDQVAADEEREEDAESAGSRRRRRRRRAGEEGDATSDDPEHTVTRVRKARTAEDEITSLTGSTRLEAKKQRRREGREAGRRRAPIVSEAEFLARREAVNRVMVIRQKKDLTQIAVLEDNVLVEHYVARESQTSLIGNVYLGRVQNVLPSMEAAFIDIGKGRNAVLYAGEVNWDAFGAKDGQARKIESVLKSGQSVLVQVTKDPVGHKGARLTSQVSLPGRFLVYVPDGTTSGISRKLPDTERNRLKTLLKEIVPDTAGVIVRTAAEGASEEELTHDVERLTARWEDIQSKVNGGNAPQMLYGEPDLTLKVVRDLFTEDFGKLVVSGPDAWEMVEGYVTHVAPDLADRLEKYDGDAEGRDVFADFRIDEQIAKGLDRKVWLPSGGSLIIDRTEAMTVVDVNTGKFTGSGGNLEETVTKNNLEAAEEIVRQLRLRDIGGIIVVDFIDMVLESNRDLVLRRMVECLGRDRTRHQVAEVTSLGLVQMTRKRIGTGLLEAFSESCEHCQGRGVVVQHEPVEPKKKGEEEPRRNRRGGRNRGRDDENGSGTSSAAPSPKDIAAMARPEPSDQRPDESSPNGKPVEEPTPLDLADGREGVTDVDAGEPAVTDTPVADETPETEMAGPAQPPTSPSADETATAEAPPAGEPPAPKVVTSVRRRGAARRPAGPPTGAAVATISHTESLTETVGEQSAADPSNLSSDVVQADLDTRHSGDGTSELPGDVHEPAVQPHVPIKKKGSRKR